MTHLLNYKIRVMQTVNEQLGEVFRPFLTLFTSYGKGKSAALKKYSSSVSPPYGASYLSV